MVADRRLAEAERLGQVADAGLAIGLRLDEAEEAEPRRVGQVPSASRRGAVPLQATSAPGGGEDTRPRSSRSAAWEHIDSDR